MTIGWINSDFPLLQNVVYRIFADIDIIPTIVVIEEYKSFDIMYDSILQAEIVIH